MADLATRLRQGPCVLLDGGMGSMLLARGLRSGDAPERLNLERPELVEEVHRAYVQAGSEAVQTNSFGATPQRLAHFGLADRCEELNRRAVELARLARPTWVIGDVGPTGEYLPPVGQADLRRWEEGFHRQVAALVEAGVDALHVETMSDLREALTALGAIRAHSAEIPVLVSLTFDRKRRGFFTLMGDPLLPSLERLRQEGAMVAGANCTLDSRDMGDLAREALATFGGRLVVQPNAGQPQPTAEGVRYAQDPHEFATDLAPVIQGGLAAVGGCCGSDPRFIAELAHALGRG